jgi:hypothetical protein
VSYTQKGTERIANAHLIAAAPELLNILQRIVGNIHYWYATHPDGEQCPAACLLDLEHARAAIAKATGEQPCA